MTANERPSAHLDGPLGEPHWLDDHLRDVAELASAFAARIRPGDEAFAATAAWAGLLHDLGKFRPEFQQYLHGARARSVETQHSVYGAYWAYRRRLPLDLAFAILGHHAGLHDFSALKNHFQTLGESGQVDWLTAELQKRVDSRTWPMELTENRRPKAPKLLTLAEELRPEPRQTGLAPGSTGSLNRLRGAYRFNPRRSPTGDSSDSTIYPLLSGESSCFAVAFGRHGRYTPEDGSRKKPKFRVFGRLTSHGT